jgi:hypothetical protein
MAVLVVGCGGESSSRAAEKQEAKSRAERNEAKVSGSVATGTGDAASLEGCLERAGFAVGNAMKGAKSVWIHRDGSKVVVAAQEDAVLELAGALGSDGEQVNVASATVIVVGVGGASDVAEGCVSTS